MIKPSTMSRRGFLRALGLTVTTVLLGGSTQIEVVESKLVTTELMFVGDFFSWEVRGNLDQYSSVIVRGRQDRPLTTEEVNEAVRRYERQFNGARS